MVEGKPPKCALRGMVSRILPVSPHPLSPSNGPTGNMNAHEAPTLGWLQGARRSMPFTIGLWRDADYGEGATLDPQLFVDTYHRLSPTGTALFLQLGTAVMVDPDGLAS
jgi:hypothetical protein